MNTCDIDKRGSVLAIMVNWNGKDFLLNSVSSVLSELERYNGILLFVDNNSSDGSVEFIASRFPNVKVLKNNMNLGGAGGFNTGMSHALSYSDCQYIWLLDNDIIAEENALPPLIEILDQNTRAGAAGSQICLYDKPDIVQEIGSRLSPWLGLLRQYGSGKNRFPREAPAFEVDYLAACSMLIKRECLEQVGIFGNFFLFYDDVEWGLRAKSNGWQLWAVPASVIRHHYSVLKPTEAWREYYRKRNRITVLAAYSSSYRKLMASFVYLVFLNYLIFINMWRGNLILHKCLRLARDDALNGYLGKQNLPEFDHNPSSGLNIPELSHDSTVLIDIIENIGNMMAAVKQLRSVYPKINLRLPFHLKNYIRYYSETDLNCEKIEDKIDAAVIGEAYRLSSIIRSTPVYLFRNGKFILVPHPIWNYFMDLIKRIGALFIGMLLSPIQFIKLLIRYHDKDPKCFLRQYY